MIRRVRTHQGFTLVELLVVISILTVLVALSIAVGTLVTRGGTERATQSLLTTLDRALDEYVSTNGSIPPFAPGLNDPQVIPGAPPLVEYEDVFQPPRPDAAVFVSQVSGTEARTILEEIPDRFRFNRAVTTTGPVTEVTDPTNYAILDAWFDGQWDRPFDLSEASVIYYVHPENTLAQDLYGACVNNRPYFLSPGADGLYGLNEDPYIPQGLDGSAPDAGGTRHTYQTVLKAQEDNLTSYDVAPINERAFERTRNAGVR